MTYIERDAIDPAQRQDGCPGLAGMFARIPASTPEELAEHVRSCPSCRHHLEQDSDSSEEGPLAPWQRTTASMPGQQGAAAPTRLERGLNLGRYVLLDKLGEGGMGVVYAAYDSALDRKVALKFLRAFRGDRRLLREAQVMARLSHANIVGLFDAASFEGREFVSMEYVDGVDLRAWLERDARSWQEMLFVLREAGRGLVALHDAGMVHRDFKPENVLVSREGAVKVSDFGLTRPAEALQDDEKEEPDFASDSLVHQRITRRGSLVGTPQYMAPELVRGAGADALTDQFAFCVAAHEALFGESPFVDDARTRWKSGRWTLRPAPEKSAVPAWVRRALARGLSEARERRFPSMAALLEALDQDPHRRRARRLGIVLGAAALVAAVAGSAAYVVRAESQLCRGAERKLAGIWDAPRRNTIMRALEATALPYAPAAAQTVARTLDSYVSTWVRLHTEACEATHRRGEASPQILEQRMTCLDRRLRELDALTQQLAKPDARVVEKAVQASTGLTGLAACLDLEANRFSYDVPRDERTRMRVAAVRKQLDQARALEALGKPKEALPLSEGARTQAQQVGYGPLEAEALFQLGQTQFAAGDKTAEGTLLAAVRAAEAARHDEVAAAAWVWLVPTTSELLGKVDLAEERAQFAEAALERLGGRPGLEARLWNAWGLVARGQGKYDVAIARFERALVLAAREYGPDSEYAARIYNNMGTVYGDSGKPGKPAEMWGRALALFEKALGPEHPVVGMALNNVAMSLAAQNKFEEAIAAFRRALTVKERVLGPEHPSVAQTVDMLGRAYRELDAFDEALAFHRRALAIKQKTLGTAHPGYAETLYNEGMTLNRARRFDEAATSLGEAVRLLEQTDGPEPPLLARALVRLGESDLGRSRLRSARAELERALALQQKLPNSMYELGTNEFLLAQTLVEAHAEHARAVDLAHSARGHFASQAPKNARETAEVERWLTTVEPKNER